MNKTDINKHRKYWKTTINFWGLEDIETNPMFAYMNGYIDCLVSWSNLTVIQADNLKEELREYSEE